MTTLNTSKDTLRHFIENDQSFSQYKDRSLELYALSEYLGIGDPQYLKMGFLTDGPDDKSCDYCIVDPSSKRITIVQAYFAQDWSKEAAPANKASDLNKAVAWLFLSDLEGVPASLFPFAQDCRQLLSAGDIDQVDIIYVHNCPSSKNVSEELKVVGKATESAINKILSGLSQQEEISSPKINVQELGLEEIFELHEGTYRLISVSDTLELSGEFALEHGHENWESTLGIVYATDLVSLFKRYGTKLFSANVRNYLGSRKTSKNINYRISQTAASEPDEFYAFNNGITVLTKSFSKTDTGLSCDGISIINGAQTTGALAAADGTELSKVRVMCRVIKCSKESLVQKIVQFNNTQNAIKAADRKSGDPTQERLLKELTELGISYRRRRGDTLKPGSLILDIDSISQSLASFHSEFNVAIRSRQDVFENDDLYHRLFGQKTTARHLLLLQALDQAISNHKEELQLRGSNRTDSEKRQLTFLEYAAGKQFVLAVMGNIQEVFLRKKVADRFSVKVKAGFSADDFPQVVEACMDLIKLVMPLIMDKAGEDLHIVVRSNPSLKEISKSVSALLESILTVVKPPVEAYQKVVVAS